MVAEWLSITLEALKSSWEGFLLFLPKFIGATIVFLVGWTVAIGVGKLISETLKKLRVDKFFEKTNWKEVLERAEINVTVSEFIGEIVRWILVIIFLLASVEILGLSEFAEFLRKVVLWLPNLLVGILILVVGVILAEILEKIIKAGVKKMEVSYAGLLASITKIAIYVFAVLAALSQLGVTPVIVNAIIFGLIGTLVLSLGLAFGLGGKEAAAKIIEQIMKKFEEK